MKNSEKFDLRKFLKENEIKTGNHESKDLVVQQKNPYNDVVNEIKLKMPKTAEEASQQAMDWQSEFSSKSTSWAEVIKAGDHFRKLAKKFNLTAEFEENGII